MLDVKRVATIALTSALLDWEGGHPLSLITIREIRLAHSLLVDGEPSGEELRPFLGKRWVIRSRRCSANVAGVNAVSEAEYVAAQMCALAVRLGLSERFVVARLRDARSTPPTLSSSPETISNIIRVIDDAWDQQQEEDLWH